MVVITDDLLVEIFVRLPFKSLARFKCVSRSWHAIISGGYLRRRLPLMTAGVFVHVKRDNDGGDVDNKPRYAAVRSGGLAYCDMSFFPSEDGAKLVDACNGLLLYRSRTATAAFYVTNPTTKRWVALPSPQREAQLPILAFDPRSSSHYHVVCFTAWQEKGASVEVFSSETGTWAEHDVHFGVEASSLSAIMHYHGGVLYILAYSNLVVCMDLGKMALCKLVKLPQDMDSGARLAHCRGRLHYLKSYGQAQLKVWMLQDWETWRWELKHVVGVNGVLKGGWRANEAKILALHLENDVVYLWSPWKLVSYDLRKKETVEVWEIGGAKEGETHVIRFWLLDLSCFWLNCL